MKDPGPEVSMLAGEEVRGAIMSIPEVSLLSR